MLDFILLSCAGQVWFGLDVWLGSWSVDGSALMLIFFSDSATLHHQALLRVSALHYSAGSWVLEGFRTVASACALHQPTIVGPSISRINVHKFGT